jgi:hypothetical protein
MTPSSGVGNFLTGAGTQFDQLTIRVRLNTSALDTADFQGEGPLRLESEPTPEPPVPTATDQEVAVGGFPWTSMDDQMPVNGQKGKPPGKSTAASATSSMPVPGNRA